MTWIFTLLGLSMTTTAIAAVVGVFQGLRFGPGSTLPFSARLWLTPCRSWTLVGSSCVALVAAVMLGGTALSALLFGGGIVAATWLAPRALLAVAPWFIAAVLAGTCGVVGAVQAALLPDSWPVVGALLVATPFVIIPTLVRCGGWMRADIEHDESIPVIGAPVDAAPRPVFASARTMGAAPVAPRSEQHLLSDPDLIVEKVKATYVAQSTAMVRLREHLRADWFAFSGPSSTAPFVLVLAGPKGCGKRTLAYDFFRAVGLGEGSTSAIQACDGLVNELVKFDFAKHVFLTVAGVADHAPTREWLSATLHTQRTANYPHHAVGKLGLCLLLDIETNIVALSPEQRLALVAEKLGPKIAHAACILPFAQPEMVDRAKIASRIIVGLAHRAGVANIKSISEDLLVEVVDRASAIDGLSTSEALRAAASSLIGRSFDSMRGTVDAVAIKLGGSQAAPIVMFEKTEFVAARHLGVQP